MKIVVLYVEFDGTPLGLASGDREVARRSPQRLLVEELRSVMGANSESVWSAETDPRWLAAQRAGRVTLLEGTTVPALVH